MRLWYRLAQVELPPVNQSQSVAATLHGTPLRRSAQHGGRLPRAKEQIVVASVQNVARRKCARSSGLAVWEDLDNSYARTKALRDEDEQFKRGEAQLCGAGLA